MKRFLHTVLLFILLFSALYAAILIAYDPLARFSEPPSQGDVSFFFSEDLWREIVNTSSLNVEIVWEKLTNASKGPILERQIFFTSEIINGTPLRVNAILLVPLWVRKPPVLVFQHGYGQRWADFYTAFYYLVSEGDFAIFAIDAPDCGNSSSIISKDPRLLASAKTPYECYLFHEALAIMRGITYLTTLEEIDSSKIIMSGVSMGGIMTFYVTAVDSRVIGGVPIVASGNLLNALGLPKLIHGMLLAEDEETYLRLIKWFDPIHYARMIKKPVLYMVASNDEYFSLRSCNDTFSAIPSKDKRFVIFPDGDHMGVPWMDNAFRNIIRWVRHVAFGEEYPSINYSVKASSGLIATINVEISGSLPAYLYYRSNIPSSDYVEVKVEGSRKLFLFSSRRYYFFVALKDDEDIVAISPLYCVNSFPIAPIVLLLASLALLGLAGFQVEFDMKRLFTWLSLTLATFSPVICVVGRGHWSLLHFLEVYKVLLFYDFKFTLLTIAFVAVAFQVGQRARWLVQAIACFLVICEWLTIFAFLVLLRTYGLSWKVFPVIPGLGLLLGTAFLFVSFVLGGDRS